jgi:hypothetical protein
MGRSGTSAVTRALVSSGFYVGADSELMQATAANPAGFWENSAVCRVNEEILADTGGTWFDPPTSEAQLVPSRWAVPKLRKLLDDLRSEAGGAPVAIKDPRIGVLLKIWAPVIDAGLHPVLVVRNPVEIALSLGARDGTPTAFTLASWELHMARVLEYLHGRAVTVAPYAELVSSSEVVRLVVGAVASRLSAECVTHIDLAAAPTAILPGLYRNRASEADLSEHLTGRQADLWRFLDGLSPGNHVLSVPRELTRPSHAASALARCEIDRLRQSRYMEPARAQLAAHGPPPVAPTPRPVDTEEKRDGAAGEPALVDQQRADAGERGRRLPAERRGAQAERCPGVSRKSSSWRLVARWITFRAARRARATFRRSA